jgi:hypothetical protein
MPRNDDQLQDAVPSQKLEWVTPKISPLEAGDTDGNKNQLFNIETTNKPLTKQSLIGPS